VGEKNSHRGGKLRTSFAGTVMKLRRGTTFGVEEGVEWGNGKEFYTEKKGGHQHTLVLGLDSIKMGEVGVPLGKATTSQKMARGGAKKLRMFGGLQ